MKKTAIICNSATHVVEILGLNPNHPKYLVITPERTEKMKGHKDIEYYEMRPMLAREKTYADSHGWKRIEQL